MNLAIGTKRRRAVKDSDDEAVDLRIAKHCGAGELS